MKFFETNLYKEIKQTEKIFTVPYYTYSGIIINENNITFIIEIELKKAEDKLKIIGECEYDFTEIKNKIIKKYFHEINTPYKNLEFIYFNKLNVDEQSSYIENLDNFCEWLIE